MTTASRATTLRDHGIGAGLALLYVVVLMATAGELGMNRDESMYVTAAESYGRWLQLLWTDSDAALTEQNIERHWKVNREHPPLAKLLFALSYLAHRHYAVFSTDSMAFRFPGMLSAGLLLWLIYVFGVQLRSRPVGLFAACGYALLPRPFYHAHLNCFDVPITLAVTFVVYCYYRSLRSPRRYAPLLGLAFGLALATKHNSWVLPGIFAIHFLLLHFLNGRGPGRSGVPKLPYWLLAMVALGPPLLWGLWPWLWVDGWERFAWYARFHLKHEYYNMAYFGVNYFWPPFPVGFPWVMTLYTVPVTTLLLGLLGLVHEGRAIVSQLRARLTGVAVAGSQGTDPTHPGVLLLGCLFAPLVMISLPSTPIFGGT